MSDSKYGLTKQQWAEKLQALGGELEKMGLTADIVIFGSVPNVLAGQSQRTTMDLDIWNPSSTLPKGFRKAVENAGLIYNPTSEIEPDSPYVQIVKPGIVQLGTFRAEHIGDFGGLSVQQPPAENLIASKLCRASENDIDDIAWLLSQTRLNSKLVKQVIDTFPQEQRETAKENLVYLHVLCFGQVQDEDKDAKK